MLFDYLSVTFPIDESEEIYIESRQQELQSIFANEHFNFIIRLLDLDKRKYTDDGKIEHYNRLITYGEFIHFKYNGPKDRNNCPTHSFEIKGEGCREVERLGINWYALFAYIHENNLSVSTLHVACDVFHSDYFTLEQLLKKAKRSEYTSTSRSFNYIEGTKGGVKTGISLYFGRRDDNQINIYDKKNERYYKGYDVDTNIWYRVEMRLKANKSWSFIRLLIANGMDHLPILFSQTLKGMLEFKTKSKDLNKTRWKTWRKWDKFLNCSSKVILFNQAKLESSLVQKRDWLIKSAGKIILEYFSSIDDEEKNKFYTAILEEKLEKIDNKSLVRINDYRKTKDLTTFRDLNELKDYINKNIM